MKIQYPGAATALMADLNQLARFARLFAALFPGMDVKPLIAELKARVVEELDYGLEADAQRQFAAAYARDPDIAVPRVVASAPKVIVSEWIDGTPLSKIIATGTAEQRNQAGLLLSLLHFSGPERAGMLHADPHPGNFRILDDGRLGVIDFGATARLPDGHPEPIGRLLRWALAGKADEVLADLRVEGFVRPNVEVHPEAVLDYLRPLLDPVSIEPLPLHAGLDAGAGGADRRPAQRGQPAGAAAQPAPGLSDDPPGDDRVDRRPLPTRRRRRLPQRPGKVATGFHE